MTDSYIKPLLFFVLFTSFFCCKQQEPPAEVAPAPAATNYPEIDNISSKIDATPENHGLYAARAEKFYEIEAYDQALEDVQRALKKDSTNARYLHLLSDIYLDYARSQKALKAMELAARYHPKRIPTLLKLGELQLILKQHGKSFETLDRIMKIDPLNAEGFYLAGRVFRDRGEIDKAIASMQKAVDNEPDILDAWLELGDMYAEKENPKAVRYYDAAIRVDTNYNFARFRKAFYLHQIGELDEAIAQYRQVTIKDYNFVDAYYNSGLAYFEKGTLKEAYEQFNIACQVDPDFLMAFFYRGTVAEQMGDQKKAIADFTTTVSLDPGFTRGHEALKRVKKETALSENASQNSSEK